MSITLQTLSTTNLSEIAPFYFRKQKNGSYLITNEFGYYSYLTDIEFQNFYTGKIIGEKLVELDDKLFLKNSSYEDRAVIAYNRKNSFLAFGPTLHMIVTTLRCPHKCLYCHAAVAPMTAKNLDMTIETARKVVDTIFYTSSPSLTIEFQ